MKKNTYPVAKNKQAEEFRKIFDSGYTVDDATGNVTTTAPGRIKGINNSPNLIGLFKNSPFYPGTDTEGANIHTAVTSANTDRGKFFENINTPLTAKLTNEIISDMFAYVVDGSQKTKQSDELDVPKPHVQNDIADGHNYNWLYRDQPMDMNFNYLKPTTPGEFQKSSPDKDTAPVGSNAPIPDGQAPSDKPFWGHANLNVPSIEWDVARDSHAGIPQLQRGTGGFGTSFPVSNRAFAAQEQIGQYFTNSYIDPNNAGLGTMNSPELDRMDKFGGKSIKDRGEASQKSADYAGDVDKDGNSIPATPATQNGSSTST